MNINIINIYKRNIYTVYTLYGYTESLKTLKVWLDEKQFNKNTFENMLEYLKIIGGNNNV
jgi:hypothetical protein